MKEVKLLTLAVVLVAFVFLIAIVGISFRESLTTIRQPIDSITTPLIGGGGVPVSCPGMAATPTVTIRQTDIYNPKTAISGGINMYNIAGGAWVDVAVGGTIQKSYPTVIELVSGIDSDDEAAQEYGPYYPSRTIPCLPTETFDTEPCPNPCLETRDWVIYCANDALSTDLTGAYFDKYGTVATATSITAGNNYNLKASIMGKYETDYGNRYCGLDPAKDDYTTPNLFVFWYNSTSIDGITLTSIYCEDTGEIFPIRSSQWGVPVGISSTLLTVNASNKGFKAYEGPVIKSSNTYYFKYTVDGDDTAKFTTNDLNLTYWDSTWYQDDNVGEIKWGPEDENNVNIGAASYLTITPTFN